MASATASSTPVTAPAAGSPAVPTQVHSGPPSGVAQLFVEWEDKSGNKISAKDQCQQIVDAVRCLVKKGYKRVGLTYSANQKPQTQAIFREYKFDPIKSNNDFNIGVPKTIKNVQISGVNQAATLMQLDAITTTDVDFRKVFRIIPLSTMETGGGGQDVDKDALGKSSDCIEYAKQFLALPNSIILGWCDQYTKKNSSLLDLEPGDFKDINKLIDDAYTLNGSVGIDKIQAKFQDPAGNFYIDKSKSVVFTNPKTGADYLPKRKKHINIGGDMAEKTTNTRTTYIPEYLKFLVGRWNKDAQQLVDECQSASPKAAPATDPATDPAPAPAPITIEKKSFAEVLTDLEGQLSEDSENDAGIRKLGITLPKNFLYPPDSDTSVQKNLNSADPAIDAMITAFETADGGETNFYLGACRSIKAAYKLEFDAITGSDASADEAKMRAKLLLNLRKNSLLLKVPARWDYATMTIGVEVEPVMEPPFSVPLQNESGHFCFENVAFQLLFSIDSVRQMAKQTEDQIKEIIKNCSSITDTAYSEYCQDAFLNTYHVLHLMEHQYEKDKTNAPNADEYKKKLENIKNILLRDKSGQADAAEFLTRVLLLYLVIYEPINNSICFKQYELTLCTHDIDNSDLDINIDGVDKLYKYETKIYKDKTKNTYNFSKKSVLNEIGVNVDNKKLLDIANPVGVAQTSLMCFTNKNTIQECIDDYLSEKNLEINNDTTSATYEEQTQLQGISKCEKENTIKYPVLYIPETQKYLIVTLGRFNEDGTMNNSNVNVSEKITINADEQYGKKVEFKLRGVICKTGSEKGGHYVYISYEDDKKILYNDSAPPTDFTTQFNMDTQGYVFLYEKVTSQSGGSNNIPRPITYTNAANTTHTASKSKHNSSFKVSSSSKSKSKSRNRSHTQRVK